MLSFFERLTRPFPPEPPKQPPRGLWAFCRHYTRGMEKPLLVMSLLTTLVAVIIDRQSGEYFYFGIGDSLILKFEEDRIEELTPECAFRIQPDLLPSRVKSGGLLREETCFALMSDGVSTNRKNYQQEIALVLGSENWENKFEEIIYLNQLTQFDDMTLMLLKGET